MYYLNVILRERVRECLVELLMSVPEKMAPAVKQEATECIVAHINDPLVYSLESLLRLKPVQMLEGERIHDLLMILLRGSVEEYNKFSKDNGSYLKTLEIDVETTLSKLRVLSFLQLAEKKTELSYDAISKHVGIEASKIEPFLFEVVRTGMARLRLDQAGKKARILSLSWSRYVSSGMDQWREIQRRLNQMRTQVDLLMDTFSDKATDTDASPDATTANAMHAAAVAISTRVSTS